MAWTYATGWGAGLLAYYTEAGWNTSNTVLVTTAAKLHKSPSGVGSAYALEMNNTAGGAPSPFVSTTSRFLHFYFIAGAPNIPTPNEVYFYKDGVATAMLQITATGLVTLRRGTSGTLTSNTIIATSATNVNWGVGHWAAIELLAADAGGVFTLWIDGVQIVTFAGDTQGHSTADWNQFGFKQTLLSADDWYISDIIVTDNTTGRLAEQFCQILLPTSVDSGNLTGFSVTGASRYQNIDEIPVSQTDYNYAVAINDEDLYGFGNLPATFTSIAGIVISAEAVRAGAITGIQISCKSVATTTYSSTENLPSTYAAPNRILLLDPNTAAAWTQSGLDAALFGVKFL
jgi:hypothetical protein